MPLPLAPVAAFALRYGTVALATWAVARRIETGRRCQKAEDAHDGLDEGITLRSEKEQINATGRLKRVLRFGDGGPAIEVDASAFGRFRVRRI
ncbi:MAG: hypothetical protein KDK53_02665 [Maritimibacter sp.]|nr:hypothetical protein [Maritimibacter sp.]